MMIRYRTGLDRTTFKPLVGFAHVRQSVGVILTTLLEERVMLLDFGFEGAKLIGRNLVPPVVLAYYRAVTKAVHTWEPEYRIGACQILKADRTGALSLQTGGTYYPEGRFGNYDIAQSAPASFVVARTAAAS